MMYKVLDKFQVNVIKRQFLFCLNEVAINDCVLN